MDITFIDNSGGKEMNDLEIGDRVEVLRNGNGIDAGTKGTIIEISDYIIGVEFDEYKGGHSCGGKGKKGHCRCINSAFLRKIEEKEEETKEESKVDTLEQKILTALREEIGVEIGEEFEVYQSGERQWTCRFDKNGFARITDKGNSVSFDESWVWKYIVSNFHKYKFKKKPFVPQNGEKYWHFEIRNSLNGNKFLDVLENVWNSLLFDYGMLALGNVFRTREEAIKGEDKLLERLNELLKEE